MRMIESRRPVGVKLTSPGIAPAAALKPSEPSKALHVSNERYFESLLMAASLDLQVEFDAPSAVIAGQSAASAVWRTAVRRGFACGAVAATAVIAAPVSGTARSVVVRSITAAAAE